MAQQFRFLDLLRPDHRLGAQFDGDGPHRARRGGQVEHDNDTNNFTWGGTIGVDWHFAENMMAEVAYRYINLGEVDTGPAATGESITTGDYVSHDVLLSIFYRF